MATGEAFCFKACVVQSETFYAISPTIAAVLVLVRPYWFALFQVGNILRSRGPTLLEVISGMLCSEWEFGEHTLRLDDVTVIALFGGKLIQLLLLFLVLEVACVLLRCNVGNNIGLLFM